MRGKPNDLTGQRFGRLVVTDRAPNEGNRVAWRCRCDCGEQTTVLAMSLRSPKGTRSCGCLWKNKEGTPERRQSLNVAVTDAEHAAIVDHCRGRGITISSRLRMMLSAAGLVEHVHGQASSAIARRAVPEPPRNIPLYHEQDLLVPADRPATNAEGDISCNASADSYAMTTGTAASYGQGSC